MRDEHRQILSGHIDKEVIKNAYLTDEVARLKQQLKKSDHSATKSTEHDDEESIDATVSADEYHHIVDKYGELSKKYQETSQRLKYVERKNGTLARQNKDIKETARSWQKYCDHLEKKTKLKLEARLSTGPEKLQIVDQQDVARPPIPSSPGSTTIRTPRSLVELERPSPAFMHPPSHVEFLSKKEIPRIDSHLQGDHNANPVITETNVDLDEPREGGINRTDVDLPQLDGLENFEQVATHDISMIPEENPSLDGINSSQTTEDEVATQRLDNYMKTSTNTEHDDAPQFVSERSLKRKRMSTARFNVYSDRIPSDGTPVRPFIIKEEQSSSPPASISAHHLLRKETMDLDELGPNVISTPQRRRRRRYSTQSNQDDTLRHERSTSEPLIKNEPIGGAHKTLLDNPAVLRTVELHGTVTDEARACSEPSDSRQLRPNALQPVNPNIQTSENADQETQNKRRRKDQARERKKYQVLTESGEELPQTNENYTRLASNIARTQFNRKLQAKNAQTPAKLTRESLPLTGNKSSAVQIPTPPSSSSRPKYTPSSWPGSHKTPSKELSPDVRFGSCEAPISDSRPAWHLQLKKDSPYDAKPNLRRGGAGAPIPQQQAPLRNKPKSELQTSDFKANPAYNNGYSYAFAETVRKRADRACLPGCTRPECCGSTFRAIAAVATPLSTREEEKLLEEFLGDAYDTMVSSQMSSAERKELVLQARTRQMSKQVGRHKQVYERHTTPPGFWRIDFPTTQEDMEDRRKAAEQERVLVEERWMEAMRKGGRWMFKDE
jgi:hypothetical protein